MVIFGAPVSSVQYMYMYMLRVSRKYPKSHTRLKQHGSDNLHNLICFKNIVSEKQGFLGFGWNFPDVFVDFESGQRALVSGDTFDCTLYPFAGRHTCGLKWLSQPS